LKYDPIFSYLFTITALGSVISALLMAFGVLHPLGDAALSVIVLLLVAVTTWDARSRLREDESK
jgi:uncharacterized membrane protein YphA (DoxX/SURF4 family)